MPRYVLLLAGVTLLVAACSPDTPATGPATPQRSAAAPWMSVGGGALPEVVPSADPSATEDAPGALACGRLASAMAEGTLMNPGVVDAITAASASADAPIADAAQRLAGAYGKAAAAVNTENEPDAVAAVSAAGAELAEVCGESGLDTVG